LIAFIAAVTPVTVSGPMQTRRSAVKFLHRIFISVSDGPITSHSAATTSLARSYNTRPVAPQLHHRWQLQRISRRQFAAEAHEVDVGAQLLVKARRRNKLWQRFGILGMLLKYMKLPCTQRLTLQSLWSISLLWDHIRIGLGITEYCGCKWATSAGAAAAGVLAVVIYQKDLNQESLVPERVEEAVNKLLEKADEHHLYNWSNTHECRPKRFYQPETQEELENIVAEAHEKGKLIITKARSCSTY